MKKLSLVLALLLVLTCGVLAACNDEGDASSEAASEATSEAVSKEDSKTEDASSEAVSEEASSEAVSEEASSEAVSEEASSEAEVSAPEAGDANLALGKSYTRSQLYRQGGEDVQWAWDDNAAIAYPDEDEKSLTDGFCEPTPGSNYSDPVWAGFHYGCPDYETNGYSWVTVDLGESKDLAKFVLHVGTSGIAPGAGISAPAKVEFLVSDDGETWTSVGEVAPENTEDTSVPHITAEVSAAAKGQYVQVRVSGSSFLFVSEIEVFGAAE